MKSEFPDDPSSSSRPVVAEPSVPVVVPPPPPPHMELNQFWMEPSPGAPQALSQTPVLAVLKAVTRESAQKQEV